MSFHTFPEKGIVSFDFFTCGSVSPNVSLEILKKELPHSTVIKKDFDRDSVHHYKDIYSSEGIKKFYMVEKIIKNFKSKAGQHIEILKLKEFGNALFIDSELQVAERDEELYSSTFVNSGLKLSEKNSTAAIIGGGDGGVARECIKNNFNYIKTKINSIDKSSKIVKTEKGDFHGDFIFTSIVDFDKLLASRP